MSWAPLYLLESCHSQLATVILSAEKICLSSASGSVCVFICVFLLLIFVFLCLRGLCMDVREREHNTQMCIYRCARVRTHTHHTEHTHTHSLKIFRDFFACVCVTAVAPLHYSAFRPCTWGVKRCPRPEVPRRNGVRSHTALPLMAPEVPGYQALTSWAFAPRGKGIPVLGGSGGGVIGWTELCEDAAWERHSSCILRSDLLIDYSSVVMRLLIPVYWEDFLFFAWIH